MNRHMVGEAGSRFFELASSLGRIHADTLNGMAEVTARTPLGPVFALNASFARLAQESMETMTARLAPTGTPAPAAKPAPMPETAVRAKPEPKPKPKAKAAPKRAKTPAPFAVEAEPATALADAMEPDAADVLIEDVMVEDVLAEIEKAPMPVIAPALTQDDLSRITGIGATTAKKLNGAGVESFAQIAAMSEGEFATLLESLDIRSIRFSPALWIAEAAALSS